MTQVAQIFNNIKMMNPKSTMISSMGEIITEDAKQTAQYVINETVEYLPAESLAMKIIREGNWPFTEKQLWVIAYELVKNPEYVAKMEAEAKELAQREEMKRAAKRAKRAAKSAAKISTKELEANNNEFVAGDKVNHPTFGEGTVVATDAKIMTVNFGGVEKKLMKAYTRGMSKIN